MTLFERVFGGNDAVYGLTEAAIDNAIAQYGEGQAVSFPDTAYSLPCYYAVTGVKVNTLGELKVEEIGKEGETFDASLHNAVMHVEDEAYGENVIVQVLQKGYRLGDRVIRYAMVKVAN